MTERRTATSLSDLLPRLTVAELAYAQAYAEHVAVGDPKPDGAGIDPAVCEQLRRLIDGEWRQRLNGSPALSGRLRIERRARQE